MTDLLILCEKKSAYDKFSDTFKGVTGTFEGQTYKLTHAKGHLLELKNPDKQLKDDSKADQYASWTNLEYIPWNLSDFTWAKVPKTVYNRITHKRIGTTTDLIKKIADAGKDCSALVIGTDIDPSGEGDLLAWEIINAIHWKKPVYRMRFSDDTGPKLIDALHKKDEVTDQSKQGEYFKGIARERFDYGSMQLTRVATLAARNNNVQPAMRVGRLKSVILAMIFKQWELVNSYVRKPYYEVQYTDPAGHVFKRQFVKDKSDFRFAYASSAENDAKNYLADKVTNVKKVPQTTAPGSLLDMSGVAGRLAKTGIPASTVESVYQSLYEAEYLSYPRTSDTKITQDQYNELLPLVDRISSVVGVDPKLLTHRTLREKHRTASADHGANRPNLKVPTSLHDLDQKFGPAASKIYKLVALSFLSILGEDYEYNHVTANLLEHPDFKTSFNIPVAANYRLILNSQVDDEKEEQLVNGPLGPTATSNVHEGANTQPAKPTQSMISGRLKKLDVGTGATRLHAFVELTARGRELSATKSGVLSLSPVGAVNAALIQDTWISDPNITARLFAMLQDVSLFKKSVNQVLQVLTNIVNHDKPIILRHGSDLSTLLKGDTLKKAQSLNISGHKTHKGTPKKSSPADYVNATFEGKKVTFKRNWGGEDFTENELAHLLDGEKIVIKRKGAKGNYQVRGHLDHFSFKGKTYFGFVKDEFIN